MDQNQAPIYLYGIIATPESFKNKLKGIDGGSVYLIQKGTLSAVVTDAKEDEYPLSRKNALHHQEIIEKVRMKHGDILPVSFGTVAKTRQSVHELLKTHGQKFRSILDDIKGKVEISVKGLWRNLDDAIRELAQKDTHLSALAKGQPQAVSLGTAIEVGKQVESSLSAQRQRMKRLAVSKVSSLVDNMKELPLYTEQMVFNLAFLASHANGKQVTKAMEAWKKELASQGIILQISGPVAPYNFIVLPLETKISR